MKTLQERAVSAFAMAEIVEAEDALLYDDLPRAEKALRIAERLDPVVRERSDFRAAQRQALRRSTS